MWGQTHNFPCIHITERPGPSTQGEPRSGFETFLAAVCKILCSKRKLTEATPKAGIKSMIRHPAGHFMHEQQGLGAVYSGRYG
jgi:hypothetical protein